MGLSLVACRWLVDNLWIPGPQTNQTACLQSNLNILWCIVKKTSFPFHGFRIFFPVFL